MKFVFLKWRELLDYLNFFFVSVGFCCKRISQLGFEGVCDLCLFNLSPYRNKIIDPAISQYTSQCLLGLSHISPRHIDYTSLWTCQISCRMSKACPRRLTLNDSGV
jgi:hypothetical protein